MSASSSELKIKAIFGQDIRRLNRNETNSIEALKECVATVFDIQNTFRLQYNDDEEDLVTIDNDCDLQDALQCAESEKRKSLRIFVIQPSKEHIQSELNTQSKSKSKSKLIESLLSGNKKLSELNEEEISAVIKEIGDADYPQISSKEYQDNLIAKSSEWMDLKKQHCFLCGKDEQGEGKYLGSMFRNRILYTSFMRGTHMQKDMKHKVAHIAVELDLDPPTIAPPPLTKMQKLKSKEQKKKEALRQQQIATRQRFEAVNDQNSNSLNTKKNKLKESTSAPQANETKKQQLQSIVHPSTIGEPKVDKVDVGVETEDEDNNEQEMEESAKKKHDEILDIDDALATEEPYGDEVSIEDNTEQETEENAKKKHDEILDMHARQSNKDETETLKNMNDTFEEIMEKKGHLTMEQEGALNAKNNVTRKQYGLPMLPKTKRKRSKSSNTNENDKELSESEPPKKKRKKEPKTCTKCSGDLEVKQVTPDHAVRCDGICDRVLRKRWTYYRCKKKQCDYDICKKCYDE